MSRDAEIYEVGVNDDDCRDLVQSIVDSWRRELPEVDSVSASLARRVVRLATMLEDSLAMTLAPWGLTRVDFGVLNTLRSAGAPYELRPGDLKVQLLLTSGGVSNALNRLERMKMLVRTPDEADGRSLWVGLTLAGVETAEATMRSWARTQHDFFRAATDEYVDAATDSLRRVLIELGDVAPKPSRVRRLTPGEPK